MHNLKILATTLAGMMLAASLTAQRECGTPTPDVQRRFDPDILARRMSGSYMLNLYVHVFANDDGSNRAAPDSMIYAKLEDMQEYFEPHDICFHLINVFQHNNSDLNYHITDEEDELDAFIIPDAINMFIHTSLHNGEEDLNGTAYDIPNTYFSLSGDAIISNTNRSTAPHELGHCLGLYHTFETVFGVENVDRIEGCANCSWAGDGLCDTPADPHSEDYDTFEVIDTNCIYTGQILDNCEDLYLMDPTNIMAYGRHECRDNFTPDQGAVMRMTIEDESDISDCLAQINILFPPTWDVNFIVGFLIYTASNSILVTGDTYQISGLASGYFGAPSVVITPSVRFAPESGQVVVRAENVLCD